MVLHRHPRWDRSPPDVHALLEQQQHLITPTHVRDLGHPSTMLSRLRAASILERLDGGVHGTSGVPMTWERTLLTAVFAAGRGAQASHRAAARLLGIPT